MKKFYQIIAVCFLFLTTVQNVQSQLIRSVVGPTVTIVGNTSPTVGSTESYTISLSEKMLINSANWSVSSGGTTSGLSDFFNVSITWNSTGTQTIYYNITSSSSGAMQATLTVTPTGGGTPASPPSPTIVSSNCSSGILAASGIPPTGDTWYWQGTNPNGTSTANPATSNYTTTSTGKHYIRAYKASSGQWSVPSSVNVSFTITIWYPDPDGDGFGGGLGTLTQCNQPTGYVANNDDDCPLAYGEAAYNGCPPPVQLSNENYIYTIVPQVQMTSLNQMGRNSDALKDVNYFDGLGRLKQTVAIRQSGISETDIVTHAEYDNLGRQKKEYLPYVVSNINGEIHNGAKTATENYYKLEYPTDINTSIPNPFSEKEFGASPLSRIKKQASPGYDWRLGGGHEIESDYNSNSGNEVRDYQVTTVISGSIYIPTLVLNTSSTNNNGYYKAGELTKMVTRDENHTSGLNNTVEEFKNSAGQLILKRTYSNADINADGDTLDSGESQVAHDTYYVYDDFGNLTYVLSPKSEAQTNKPNSTELNELCYQYKYDNRNRMVEKKIPGKGKEYIIYDDLDRPVMTQDANQVSGKEWLFTKYDRLGRVVYTGKYNHSSIISGAAMQTHYDNMNYTSSHFYEQKVTSGTGVQSSYYTNDDFPKSNIEVLTVNYYDNYNFNLAGSVSPSSINYIYEQSGTPDVITTRVLGLPTGTKVKTLGQSKWTTTINYYDERGRGIYTYAKNEYLNTTDII